jgi:hypothetical protein
MFFENNLVRQEYGLRSEEISKDQIESKLREGALILAGTTGIATTSTGQPIVGNHIVVIRGVTLEGQMKISDPGGWENIHVTVDIDTAKSSFSNLVAINIE